MKAKAEASGSLAARRMWHVGRCPRCRVARAAVEAGYGEAESLRVLRASDYVVSLEAGPVTFRPHEGCA
jgi:hypothetical protein